MSRLTEGEYANFCIPSHDKSGKGLIIKALTIELKDDTLHGLIHLPVAITATIAPTIITALQAALFSLEGKCHNHPTHPLSPGENIVEDDDDEPVSFFDRYKPRRTTAAEVLECDK